MAKQSDRIRSHFAYGKKITHCFHIISSMSGYCSLKIGLVLREIQYLKQWLLLGSD